MTKSSTMNIVVAVFGVLAMLMAFVPTAFAGGYGGRGGSDDVDVSNSNGAIVLNGVSASANTGSNDANGGDGSGGGDGGRVHGSDDDNTGGAGGNGGNGGNGGAIFTGNATADAGVLNVVNSNGTDIDQCDCDDDDSGDITVRNRNHAFVGNYVGADANTGDNIANGGDAGDCECGSGGDGGDVDHSDDDNIGGRGGNAGHAGNGGLIETWDANSSAGAVNIVNTNLTRVRG